MRRHAAGVSMQVKELERELGIDLVERRGNSVAITPAGQEIASRAETILHQVRELSDYAHQHQGVLPARCASGSFPPSRPIFCPRS